MGNNKKSRKTVKIQAVATLSFCFCSSVEGFLVIVAKLSEFVEAPQDGATDTVVIPNYVKHTFFIWPRKLL